MSTMDSLLAFLGIQSTTTPDPIITSEYAGNQSVKAVTPTPSATDTSTVAAPVETAPIYLEDKRDSHKQKLLERYHADPAYRERHNLITSKNYYKRQVVEQKKTISKLRRELRVLKRQLAVQEGQQ